LLRLHPSGTSLAVGFEADDARQDTEPINKKLISMIMINLLTFI